MIKIIAELQKRFPNGHEDFIPISIAEMKLHSDKNGDYAKGGDPLGNFKRVGNILSNYPGLDPSDPTVVSLIYSLKQLDCVFWQLCQGYKGEVEGIATRLGDVSVYAKLANILEQDKE